MSELRRRRGRPPQDEAGKRKEAILEAAIAEFGEKGYDAATIRAIAERADVDPALVHHYFDSKADLFADAVRLPLRPQAAIDAILDGDMDHLGERAVRYVLTLWVLPEREHVADRPLAEMVHVAVQDRVDRCLWSERQPYGVGEQVGLGVEVVVDERRVDVGALGDRTDRGRVIALLAELRDRGLEDGLLALAGLVLGRAPPASAQFGHARSLVVRGGARSQHGLNRPRHPAAGDRSPGLDVSHRRDCAVDDHGGQAAAEVALLERR